MKWLMPFSRALSCSLPLFTNTLTAAVARCGRRITTTRTPLGSATPRVSGSPQEMAGSFTGTEGTRTRANR